MERLNQLIDDARRNEGLIALDVDDDIDVRVGGRLGDAVGAGAMSCGSHHRFAAEAADGVEDAGVVGGDQKVSQQRRFGGPFVDVLDHRAAADECQRLAFEADGVKPSRDDANNVHSGIGPEGACYIGAFRLLILPCPARHSKV